ncbi:methyltransferase domain-containing protein [Chromatiaceae bacterium AAb-1]|nr:methyltransferase domain-containing protein [Chromatiaceae bacterium AAb-1]
MNRKTDRNFDSIAGKFQRNIYQSTKGMLRQQVLLRDLSELPVLKQPQRILDVGAGQGQLALALAAQGHHVTLTDISAAMLQLAQQTAKERGLLSAVSFQTASLQQLADDNSGPFSVVLCHAMLEWLAEPETAIALLRKLVIPGGMVSLMFYNKDAKRFSNMLYGNFDYVAQDMQVKKTVSLSPQHPLNPQDVRLWCTQAGFEVIGKTGVRCFHDYLRDRSQQQSHFDQLLQLELQYNRTEPYASLGRYQHLLLRAV